MASMFTPHVSTRLFDVTYLNAENYNSIVFLQHSDLKKQNKTHTHTKKKIDLPTLPIFRPKGQTNLYFFRPYIIHAHEPQSLTRSNSIIGVLCEVNTTGNKTKALLLTKYAQIHRYVLIKY